jgi:hypothetical protein
MRLLRVIGIFGVLIAALTVVPHYDTHNPTQTIKDEVKALRSIIPMRHPENKSILVQVGKHKAKKAKPKKIGKYILKLNHIDPNLY